MASRAAGATPASPTGVAVSSEAETVDLSSADGLAAGVGEVRARDAENGGGHGASTPQVVKKRRTKNYKLREDATRARRTIDLRVPPFEPQTFENWDQFIQAWTQYMARTKTLYRRRSSSTAAYWNTKHKFKKFNVPDTFQYATMAYWCTHGCIQPSRGTGVRTHLHNRYTGCSARITADVVCEPQGDGSGPRWFVRVRNQISQHNHRISDEIYNCYSNNSSVPDELLLGSPLQEDEQHSAAAGTTNNFENEDAEFEASGRMISELNASIDVDTGLSRSPSAPARANGRSSAINTPQAGGSIGPALLLKEVLADDQKINMATSELQPVINELRRTSSRVIHKRLQDVSDMVVNLLAKWHQDRVSEDASLGAFIAAGAVASDDQTGVQTANEASLGASSGGMSGLPTGSQFFLASRGEPASAELTVRGLPTAGVAAGNGTADGASKEPAGSEDSDASQHVASESVV